MEEASILIALGSLLVAALSLLHTVRRSSANARALERETEERRRQIEAEAADRREQLDLLRRQLEVDAKALHDQNRAFIEVKQVRKEGGPQDVYVFRVANLGWFPAREVRATIERESGELIAERTPGKVGLGVNDEDEIRFELPTGILDRPKRSFLTLWWHDATGVNTRPQVLEIDPIR